MSIVVQNAPAEASKLGIRQTAPGGYLQQACSPAANSCFNCANEKTCGYSWLAFSGARNHTSYEPCILGMMSHGEPFFKPKASLANVQDEGPMEAK